MDCLNRHRADIEGESYAQKEGCEMIFPRIELSGGRKDVFKWLWYQRYILREDAKMRRIAYFLGCSEVWPPALLTKTRNSALWLAGLDDESGKNGA